MMASSSNRYLAWSYKVLLIVSILDFAYLQSACSSAAETASVPAALYCFNNEVVSAPRLILDVFDVKQSTSSECRCRVTSDMNTTVTLSAYQGMNAADDCDSTLLVNVGGTFSAINCFISGSYLVDGAELVLTFIKPVYNYNADYCILMTPDNSAKLTMKCDGDPLPSTPITQLSTTLMSTAAQSTALMSTSTAAQSTTLMSTPTAAQSTALMSTSTAAQSTTLMSTSTAAQSTTLMSTSTAAQSTTLKATTTSVSATTTMSSPPISSTSSMTSIKTSQFKTTVMSTSTNSPTTQQPNTFQTSSAHDSTTQTQTTVQTTIAHDSTSILQTDVPSTLPGVDKTTSHQMSTAFTSTKSSASSSRPSSVSSFTATLSSTGDTTSNAQTTQMTSVSSSEKSVSSLPTSTFSKALSDESSVVSTTHAGSTTVTPQISTTPPRYITTPPKIFVSNTNDDIEWSWVIPLIGGGIIIITGIVIACCYCYRKENSKGDLHDEYQEKASINYAYDAVDGPEFTSEVNSAFVVDEPVNHSNTKSTLPGINTIIDDVKEDISDSTNQTRGTFIRYNVKKYPKTQLYASVNKPANQHFPVNTVVYEPTTVYADVNKSNNTDVLMYAAIDHNKTNSPYVTANRVNTGLDIYY